MSGAPGGPRGERPHRGGRSGRGGGQSSKDPFDNAGNWGDDFPQADDWDNEEYTGSGPEFLRRLVCSKNAEEALTCA